MPTPIRVLVGVKRALDYVLKPRISNGKIDLNGLKHSINPFCEIAMEAAVALREKYPGRVENILSVSIGTKKCSEILRTSLAMGADRALLVNSEKSIADAAAADQQTPGAAGLTASTGIEPLAVAHILAKIVQQEKINLVLLGKQSIDDDYRQTGQMLAGLLNWPQAMFVSGLKLENDTFTVDCETDNGIATVASELPLVVTTDLRLNKPRFTKLGAIMKAKKKPISETTPQELGVDTTPRLIYTEIREPEKPKGAVMVKDVDELIEKMIERGALNIDELNSHKL